MSKAIFNIGYKEYVMNLKDAVAVAEALAKAEIHESIYRKGTDRTYHIYPNESSDVGSIKLISDSFYQMAKLAGEPVKDEPKAT